MVQCDNAIGSDVSDNWADYYRSIRKASNLDWDRNIDAYTDVCYNSSSEHILFYKSNSCDTISEYGILYEASRVFFNRYLP